MNEENFELELTQDESINEIEQIVLANALNHCKEIDDIFLQLKSEDFDSINNRIIFVVLNELRTENKKIDILSVINFIDTNQNYQFENYKDYLIELNSKFMHQPNILQYLEIIKNNSIKRKFSEFAKTLESTNLDIISSKEKLWNLEKQFLDITNNKKTKEMEKIGKIVEEYSKKLEQIINQSQDITGTPSGYPSIDKVTNGFQGGDLIILAARPGIGKTALAINFLLNASKEILKDSNHLDNHSNGNQDIVLMFSMEMGNLQICQRIVSIESGVDMNSIRRGTLDSIQITSISDTFSKLNDLPLYIDDTSDLTVLDIQSKIKQLANDKNIKLIVIDYLQLLKDTRKNSSLNRQQEVANISRMLKAIARQYNVPIIAIAQLSRKIEERRGDAKKPLLSDLRESGSIEQDADMVCFLSYKDEEMANDKKDFNNVIVEFLIAKNRNGAVAKLDLLFVKPLSKYYDANLKKDEY